MFVIEPSDRQLYQHRHRASHRGYFLLFRSYLQSSQGMHCNAITVVYGFVTVIHPGIAGQWVDELRVFAAGNDFSWEASLDDELNPCLSRSSYVPLFLSNGIHGVPAETSHTERPRWMRIKFNHRENQKGFRCFACRINRRPRRRSNAAT